MNCKRCGSPLPYYGYTCTNCGTMMDASQIKMQKERMSARDQSPEMISFKYGHKKQIYEKREDIQKRSKGIVIIMGILFLLFLFIIFVYF